MEEYSQKNIDIIDGIQKTYRSMYEVIDYLRDFETYLDEQGKRFDRGQFTFDDLAEYYRMANFYTFHHLALYAICLRDNKLITSMPVKAHEFIKATFDFTKLSDIYMSEAELTGALEKFLNDPLYWKQEYGINFRDLSLLILTWYQYITKDIAEFKTGDFTFGDNYVILPGNKKVDNPVFCEILKQTIEEEIYYMLKRSGGYVTGRLATDEESPYFMRVVSLRNNQNLNAPMTGLSRIQDSKLEAFPKLFGRDVTLKMMAESGAVALSTGEFSEENFTFMQKAKVLDLMNKEKNKVAHEYFRLGIDKNKCSQYNDTTN